VFLPGTRQRFAVPNVVAPLAIGLIAILLGLLAWAVLSTRTLSNETSVVLPAEPPVTDLRSVAYLVSGLTSSGSVDLLYIRRPGEEKARVVSEFAFPFNAQGFRAHGLASPIGDRAAIVHAGQDPAAAILTVVSLPDGLRIDADRSVDLLSPLAWSSDGQRLAAVQTVQRDGQPETQVIQFHAETGLTLDTAAFPAAHQVVPLGYSSGGQRLFIVVVDKAGSSLWVRHEGRTEKLYQFSPGPTRDWSLSPDSARLAFIDRLGVGNRTYAGKTLLIATGAITEAAPGGDQLGTAWRPGKAAADFGGPDGSVRLDTPEPEEAAYVLPIRWAPDGSMLVATIYSASRDGSNLPQESIQLVPDRSLTPNGRERLSQEPDARFIGWVRDVD
jgi:hypothetical protein